MLTTEYIFWTTAALIASHYFLFPLVIWCIATFRPIPSRLSGSYPTVTMIVAVYNEEKVIIDKMNNLLDLDYPTELIQFIIVSDGSTDLTASIAAKNNRILFLQYPERLGKSNALNLGVSHATGEIVIFSDANSFFKRDAIKKLVMHFGDSTIGGVTGRKIVIGDDREREAGIGESTYWNFESALKQKESLAGSISTADCEIFAMRKCLYKPISSDIINDDQAFTFMLITSGYRVIYEMQAINIEKASISLKDDFRVKARIVCGGYQSIFRFFSVINPFKSLFGLQYFFHKVLRYLMVFFLLIIFFSSAFMLDSIIYRILFFSQTVFYCIALLGYIFHRFRKNISFFYFPMYYCMVNAASLIGLYYFVSKQPVTQIWKKAER